MAVSVSASKTGFTPPSDVTRTLAVDLAAPSVSYTAPSGLQVGVAISAMSPTTSDTDITSYSATGLPSGLGINTATGVISGTPDTANASTQQATVTVSDSADNTATTSITFPTVAKGGPDAYGVPVRRRDGDVRQPGADGDTPERGTDNGNIHGDPT